MIYYFTGQPHAGKTTLAKMLKDFILANNIKKEVFIIDGDELRKIMDNDDYGASGRFQNIKDAHCIATYLNFNKDYDVIISMVSPYRYLREEMKAKGNVCEIYVHTENIRGREKYHYKGYQKPEEDFININTTDISEEESLKQIINTIWWGNNGSF